MINSATAPATGQITPGGVVALLVIGTAISWMFGVARGTWPSPADFVRTLSGRDVPGQEESSSEGEGEPEPGPHRVSGQEPLRTPAPVVQPGRWGARPIRAVYAERRAELGITDDETDDDSGDEDLVVDVIRPQPAHARRRWLRERMQPGDPIAAQCATVRDLEERAARDLGVDVRTIRRDRAHLAKATRTGRPRP